MKCPMCNVAGSSVFARWPDFSVEQCAECGFRYIDTGVAGYPADAQYTFDEFDIGSINPDLPHIQRRLRDILRFRALPGRSLDIGCGKGEVALALQSGGFEAHGIDMKERLIAYLRTAKPQVQWRCTTTQDLATVHERFDVLTLYHVLEHVSNPRAVLKSVKALANPGALIVIEVPNVNGLKARLVGRNWDYYKVDHVNYFRAQDLHRLAKELNLNLLDTRGYQHFSYPQNVWWKDSIKGVLGFLGFQDVISVFLQVS